MIESAKSLRNRCAIVGAGNSRLGQVPGVSSLDLLIEAIANALDDAGLKASDIDGIVSRGPDDAYCHHQLVGERLGINAHFSTSLDNGGASQILSVALAAMAIEAGLATTVICGYGRDAWSRTHKSDEARVKNQTRPDDQHAQEFGPEYGYFGAVAAHAFGAQRHMHEFGTTREQFAEIAVAFREHAMRNPDAQVRKPLTIEDYFKARPIVSPFGLFDCSLRSDGAGAVIVTSAERARDMKARPVTIRGFGSFNNLKGWFADGNMVHTAAIQSGEAAYRMAGVGPQDIYPAQLYDCFTYMVLVQLEDYGFCTKGEGGAFVQSGALRMGGALPTNTSGGQLSEAHVEGMLQIVEGVRQLRHTYPAERQVKDANIALISGHGGNQVCHSTLILERGAMTESAPKPIRKPVPRPSPESVPFWEGAKRDRLMLPRCNLCGQFWFPPSQRCRHCLSPDFAWVESKGRGRIYSFVVYYRVYHPAFETDVPYVVAIVELDEGPRLLSNIVGAAPGDVRCDMRVQVVFEDAEEGVAIPKFAIIP